MARHAFRARLVSFDRAPAPGEGAEACLDLDDGVLLVDEGRIALVGPAQRILPQLGPDIPLTDWRGCLILPGFIDCHLHFAQADIIAAHGPHLLEWLDRHTYPAEMRCADADHAADIARFCLTELLRNGTTTAMVFGTVHAGSADAIFREARQRRVRLIAGKVLMDRHSPLPLCDSAEQGYHDSAQLIERWHGQDRLAYAVTPRFAPSCTPAQLDVASRLLRHYEGVYLQTHLAENRHEVQWVHELFPQARSYLDVYDRFGLLGPRSILAHCLHLDTIDRQRFAETGAVACFCPTSNLFLGSGLFDLAAADAAGMRLALGTDVGAGTSFGMLQTLHAAYKVANLGGAPLDPLRAFYLATAGGAQALGLSDKVGQLRPGLEADFIVLDPLATPVQARRASQCHDLRDLLFALMMLGDDRSVRATYVLGERVDVTS